MAALAQVAGGMAPALSDLLTVIRGQAGGLLDGADPSSATRPPLNQIYTAAEKAVSLIRQLTVFSGQQTMQAVTLDLNVLLDETVGGLHRLVGDGVALECQPATHLTLLVADADMIEQMLIVLTQNACEAMPNGGRLRLATELVEVTADTARSWPEGRPGDFVILTVEDTGRGITPEILPRIFEPFFTTKARGQSAGLGLAAVFGIVRQHRGWIDVQSAVGTGTSFRVFLPAAPAGAVAAAGGESARCRAGGKETLLLVEDDAAVREFTVIVLKDQGYRVLQAASGLEALEVWQWHGPRIKLLLTDMVLEGPMNGLELAARLRAERPSLKVICTSGHQREDMQRFPELTEGYRFLQKPWRPLVLQAAVRALLDDKLTAIDGPNMARNGT